MSDPSSRPLTASFPALAGAALLSAVVLMLPFVVAHYPAIVDFPNHLLRHVFSVTWPDSPLSEFYTFSWNLQPNLAADLLVLPFLQVFEPVMAGKATLMVGLALWVVAPIVLHRVYWGAWSWWGLIGGIVAFNANLAMGFENYYLTAPVAMLLYAAWLWTHARWPAWGSWLVLLVSAGVVYVGHLYGWGILGLMVGGHLLGEALRRDQEPVWRRAAHVLVPCLAFLPGFLHFCTRFLFTASHHGPVETFWYGSWVKKLVALWSPVYTFSQVGDAILAIGLGAILILAASRVRLHGPAKVMLIVFGLATLAMPQCLMGVHFTDLRLPPVLIGLLVAATLPREEHLAMGRAIVVAAGALIVARSAALVPMWLEHDARTQELMAAVEGLPEGSRMIVATDELMTRPLQWNVSCYLAMEHGVFVPTVFTGGHLLRVRPEFLPMDHPQNPPLHLYTLINHDLPVIGPHYWKDWEDRFDHLLVYTEREREKVVDLPVRASGTWFDVYDLPGQDGE